jgi:hypothetical protein
MKSITQKDRADKKPCIVIVINDEKEKIAFIISGSGGTPSLPQSTMVSLRDVLDRIKGQGWKYKSIKLGQIYYGSIDSYKIYHRVVFVEVPGHTEEFLEMLIGNRIIHWLGPGDIFRPKRKIGCILTIAGLAKFADHCSVILDRSPKSVEEASRDESLRFFAKRLREGSNIMNSGKSCRREKA